MIKAELTKHPLAYIVLSLGTLMFLVSFFIFWPDRVLERIAIIAYALFYASWGIVTHRTKGQLTIDVAKEYGLVSVLGALLLLMLTF